MRATVVCGFFAYKKILGRTETLTRDRMYLGIFFKFITELYKMIDKSINSIFRQFRNGICVSDIELAGALRVP